MARVRDELSGKRLGCFCAPLPCHGDVLAEIANSEHDCLYCCLCFKTLTLKECSVGRDGKREDVCTECADLENLYFKQDLPVLCKQKDKT